MENNDEKYSELLIKYYQAMGALGYPVPSTTPESDLKCGQCEGKLTRNLQLKVENSLLRELIEKALTK